MNKINNLKIEDGKLFLEEGSIYIDGHILYFKNIDFHNFKWDADGIKEPFIVNTLIKDKKYAYVLSSYMQKLADDYTIEYNAPQNSDQLI